MKLINIICFILLSSGAFSQNINLRTNLSGKYKVSCNEIKQEFFEASSSNSTNINICDTLEIEYAENEATVKYRFYNVEFSENDTLILDFIQYYSVDTINYSSGCLDGTESISTIEIQEINKECKPIIILPEKIIIKLNSSELVLIKMVEDVIIVETGNGQKSGKKWGYSKTTISKNVIYSFSNK